MMARARTRLHRLAQQLRRPLAEDTTSGVRIAVGALCVLVIGTGVFISYGANRGLPLLPTYEISVEVPDAQELVATDQVRIGGARVGLVKDVRAIPRHGSRPPFARIRVALDTSLRPLPQDTEVQVRPGSILGGKYLEIFRGRSPRGIPEGGRLPISQGRPVTDLDEGFRIFDAQTTRGIRGVVGETGTELAGRGSALSAAIPQTRHLVPRVERVLRVLGARRTELAGFIHASAALTGALAPVAPQLGALLDDGATTIAALDAAGTSVGATIEELPPTERVAGDALHTLQPILADAVVAARALRPAARLMASANARLARALETGARTLRRRTHGTLDPLQAAFGALARDPAGIGMLRVLQATVHSLVPTLRELNPSQTACNNFGLFFRNVTSALSEGDAAGAWFRLVPILGTSQMFQSPKPSADLHLNFYPVENATECEAGREPYAPGQRIGNVPGRQAGP